MNEKKKKKMNEPMKPNEQQMTECMRENGNYIDEKNNKTSSDFYY